MDRSLLLQVDSTGDVESVRARVSAARRSGFAGIEWTLHGATNEASDGYDAAAVPPVADLDLPTSALMVCCRGSEPSGVLEHVRKSIALAGVMSTPLLSLLLPPLRRPVGSPGFATYQEGLNAVYSVLRALRFEAAAAGTVLAVVVPQDGFLFSPVEARELIDAVNAWNLGVSVDLDEVSRFGSAEDWLRTLGSRVRSVRVGSSGPIYSEASRPPCEWTGDRPAIAELLADDRPIMVSSRLHEADWASYLRQR